MSEQEAQGAGVNAQQDVSDAEFDRYFESGGEDGAVDSGNVEEVTKDTEDRQENIENKEKSTEVEKEVNQERNYKSMAHEERVRRQELQKQIEEIRTKNQRLEETFQRVMYAREQQTQQQQQPSYEDDPLGTLRSRQENLERFLASQAQAYQQQQQSQLAQQQFVNRYQESAKAFLQDRPDFLEAYKYIAQEKTREYEAAGYSPEVIVRLLHEDEAAIVAHSYNEGVNPAERIYNLAKVRGYKPASGNTTSVDSNQKMSQLEKGIEASKSLSNMSDKSHKGRMTLEDIANMSDKDFAKLDWDEVMAMG